MNKFISIDDYLMGKCILTDLPDEYIKNINILIPTINDLLSRFGEYCPLTSGFRTALDQARINPKVTHSKHMVGAAIDLSDPDKKLANWCHANVSILEELGIWCEDTTTTVNWVHCQIISPNSGRRFFIP